MFTRLIVELLPDDEYCALSSRWFSVHSRARSFSVPAGSEKLRWRQPGSGKRGGLRIFYYWDPEAQTIYMIYAIEKRRQPELTAAQTKELGRVVREELG